jgi:hypothetical protein
MEEWLLETQMYKNETGKLTLYTSTNFSPRQRVQFVRSAAETMAKQLNMSFEVVKQTGTGSPIYVYYEDGDEEPVPLYCDKGKTGSSSEITSKIRNMMFVLSFHPRHAGLKQARKMLLTPS